MSTTPTLTAVDTDERTPLEQASTAIDTADAKLRALRDLLWFLIEALGGEGEHCAAVAHSIEDAQEDLDRALDLLRDVQR